MRAAERKCKWASVEREYNATFKRHRDLEDQIAETPAEGLTGIAIKLAFCLNEVDHMQEPAVTPVATAYEAIKRVVGVDYAAQMERW